MNETQTAALAALRAAHLAAKDFTYARSFTAADLGFTASTLRSLVKAGLVETKEIHTSYREPAHLGYRLTIKGRRASAAL